MKKVVYDSHPGMLDFENQYCYIISEDPDEGDFYIIDEYAIDWSKRSRCRIAKSEIVDGFDWSNGDEVARLQYGVMNETIAGKWYFRGKWYSTETIRKIQRANQSYDWMRFV